MKYSPVVAVFSALANEYVLSLSKLAETLPKNMNTKVL